MLTASSFNNPMMFGAVAPTTANMLAEAGAALTQQIETSNTKFEAQMKAPQMAKGMADALTRVSSGDVGGFSDLAKTAGMAAGNPFLQSMFKDSEAVAARLFDSFMEKEALTQRLNMQEQLQTQRDTAAATRQDSMWERQLEREDEQLWRQQHSDWERDKATLDAAHRKEVEKIQKGNAGERRRAERDPTYTPQLIQEPPPPQYPPEPVRRTRVAVPGSSPMGAGPALPAGGGAVQGDGGLFGEGLASPPPVTGGVGQPSMPLPKNAEELAAMGNVSQQAQPPLRMDGVPELDGSAQPLPGQVGQDVVDTPAPELNNQTAQVDQGEGDVTEAAIVNDTMPEKAGKIERQIGNLRFEIQGYKPQAGSKESSETIETNTGSVTFKENKEAPPANRLADSLAYIEGNDPQFAQWIGENIVKGNKVFLHTKGTGGEKESHAYATQKNGKNVDFFVPGTEVRDATTGEVTGGTPRAMGDEDVVKAFRTAKSLMEGEMKGKFSLSVELDEAAKKAARDTALKEVVEGKTKLDTANKQLKFLRTEPVTEAEIKAIKDAQAEQERKKAMGRQRAEWFSGLSNGGGGGYQPPTTMLGF